MKFLLKKRHFEIVRQLYFRIRRSQNIHILTDIYIYFLTEGIINLWVYDLEDKNLALKYFAFRIMFA